MQISYNWLKDYCHHDLPARELADKLSHAGLCVETYEPRDGDWMLDVEVTSNRPDCLSHVGIAREVAALTGNKICPPPAPEITDAGSPGEPPPIDVQCPDLCPHYTIRLIRNVTIGPSPDWMQQRLITCGLRPVNNIVDITNYVLLESGQPMHAFDFNRLDGGRIVVRRAKDGERILTIDGTECELSPDVCTIADAAHPVAVAGVMGGSESEINGNTTDVLLESARFLPVNIRRTSRSLGLSSDSSHRFERGVDPENVAAAARRGAALIAELAGGEPEGGPIDIRADSATTAEVTMRMQRLRTILGIDVAPESITAIFEGLDLTVLGCDRGSVRVAVPPRRSDLKREIDLIEEVARIHGYDRIPETTRIPVAIAPLSSREVCRRKMKKMLAGAGFDEIITSSLVFPSPLQTTQPWHAGEPIPLRNPVSSDKTHLRLTNMGNLVGAKRCNNAHKITAVDLFEAGKIYIPRDHDLAVQPEEKCCLSLLTDRDDGFFVLKGILHNLCSTLYLPKAPTESVRQLPSFAEGKSLFFFLDEQLLGCLGVLDPKAAAGMDFATSPALMELDLDLLLQYAAIEPELRPLPKYPAVSRDIAIVVAESVRWADIARCARANAPDELESVDFLDLYRGKQVPDGKKSVAFSVSFRSTERTLRSEEADRNRDAIVAGLADAHGAQLRA